MRIAHVSDIHFGKIKLPGIVETLIDEVNTCDVDLVVISGDLTQRARRRQYEAAADMLDRMDPPKLVVPGNHDVHAWWRPHARIARPLERFKRYISADLTPRFEQDGVAVLGINSAHGKTIMGGRIGASQRLAMRDFYAGIDESAFRILVVHHHLVRIQALGPHDVARKARQTLRTAAELGVELILCGHLHISHIEPVEITPKGHRIVIASAGTATSVRGRRSNKRTNFYNLIDIYPDRFEIEERRYEPAEEVFLENRKLCFERAKSQIL